jgi:predicted membrane-bound spermidine synthase
LKRRLQLGALFAIFFVSGFCGLIYESIWSHYLKLLLGHAAYAQAVVLIVFVGGLALGAWLTGRWSERIRQPILAYALVEAGVGIMAFAFQGVFESVSAWATSTFLPAMCGAPGPCSAGWLVAAALILPASILLGTTFPLMSAGVMRLGLQPGRGLSLLYFLNSLGAALGVLVSGFVLIPWLGLPGTVMLAGAMNTVVALAAWIAGQPSAKAAPAAPLQRDAAAAAAVPGELRVLLIVAALTGLSSFIYEVVWIRMLTLVLGAATHAFELMLAPFILGLALGAWWVRNRIDSTPRPQVLLAKIQIVMGVLAVATLPLYAACFDIMAYVLRALARTDQGYALFNLTSITLAAAVMLPATICAGMTLPLVTALLLRHGHGERQVGQVYGINTFGAIAGVILAVHLLIPAVGLKWSLAFGAAVDVALGVVLWWLAVRRTDAGAMQASGRGLRWLVAAGVAAAAALVAVPLLSPLDPLRMASGVFRTGSARVAAVESEVLFHRDGKTATISVLQARNGQRSLLTNGKPDGATHPQRKALTPDDHTTIMLGALGPMHHPQARRAAVIGLGTGTTSAVLLESSKLETVDTIEIEPLVLAAAEHFRPRNARTFDDPRSHIIIDDARAHFAKTRARYDLIVSEPSNPWVSGVAGLFTVEFYRHVAAHMADDGHFVQWLHLYEASPELVSSIVRAFALVFPEFRAYGTNDADIVLVARRDGTQPQLSPLATPGLEGMRAQLRELGIDSDNMLAAHELSRGNAVKMMADSYRSPPNSDFFPYVDNLAARNRFQRSSGLPVFAMRAAPVSMLDYTGGVPAYAGQIRTATTHMPHAVRNMVGAWQGYRFLQGEKLTPDETAGVGFYLQDFLLVRSWMAGCSFPADTGTSWPSLIRVATSMNPGLSADMARTFWSQLGAGKCARSLSEPQRAWIDLLAATGARDPETTRTHAARVLKLDTQLTPETRAYAVLAAASANLALLRLDENRLMLAEQTALLPPAQLDSPWFRYLALVMTARQRAPDGPGEPRNGAATPAAR